MEKIKTEEKRQRLEEFLRERKTNKSAKRRTRKVCAVYTVGYEGLQVNAFLGLLLDNGIKRIIDVRKNPVSRVFGFHKSTLSRAADELGMEYVHCPELGVPAEWRANLNGTGDYEKLFVRYSDEILSDNRKSVREISQMMAAAPSALMCREADPSCCHRGRLAEFISGISGLETLDLRKNHERAGYSC